MLFCMFYLFWSYFIIYFAFGKQKKQNFPCHGSAAGYKCNYRVKYSKRNNEHFFCDLDIISKDTPWNEFESKYYFKKPVVINTTLSDWTKNASLWSKKSLLSLFGKYKFEVGDSFDAIYAGGSMVHKMTLASYFKTRHKKPKKYIFDRSLFKRIYDTTQQTVYDIGLINVDNSNLALFNIAHNKIKLNYQKYKMLYNNPLYNSRIISLGSTGTGLPFHHHGETWLFLTYGRKRLFAYPPDISPVGGFEPGFSSYDWYKYIYKHLNLNYDELHQFSNKTFIQPRSSIFTRNNGNTILNANSTISDILSTDYGQYNDRNFYGALFKPLECMLSDGMIMYLPEFWWHQVINLGDTVSIIMQINNEYAGYTPLKNWTSYYARISKNLQNKEFLKVLNKTDLEIDSIKMNNLVNIQKILANKDVPLNAVYQFRIGNDLCLMGHKYYKQGRKYLINTILMDPTYILAYSALASTYMDIRDTDGYSLEKAQQILEIAYIINPKNRRIQNLLIKIFTKTMQINLIQLVQNGQPLPMKQMT